MPNAVERFADIAREYRAWVLDGTDRGPEAARRALLLVGRLYVAALELPPPGAGGAGGEPPPGPGWRDVHLPLAARLPFQYYSEVFDPSQIPPEEPVVGDSAEDLADKGLRWLETGDTAGAVWEWGFMFVHHWGEHATSAVRALHCWLADERPDLIESLHDSGFGATISG